MGYLNPIEVMGYDIFAHDAAASGADGVITVDIPPEEAEDYIAAFKTHDLDPVFLLAPTSTKERISRVAAAAGGFVYYVSLKGVTGAGNLDINEVRSKLDEIRKQVSLPLGVGFGIKDAETAAAVAQVADAVIVGSALVNRIADLADQPDKILETVPAFLSTLRAAMDKEVITA
jgi:tryptophan synthase alpha chain